METPRIQVDQHGRLLLPAKLRKEQNIKRGDVFIVRVVDDEIRMTSLDKTVEKMQKLFNKYVGPTENVVDDFLEERRKEALLEEQKFNRFK